MHRGKYVKLEHTYAVLFLSITRLQFWLELLDLDAW